MPRPLVIWLGLGLVACADLEPLALGACGNQVLEAGEDCDVHADENLGPGTRCGEADTAVACRYVCGSGTSCPRGWDCGRDGTCRNASDQLTVGPTSSPWSPATFAVSDFDGDGIPDAVGAFADRIDFRRGDRAGHFAESHVVVTERVTGPVATGQLDGDAFGDVLLPTSEGMLVFRGSGLGHPLPAAYAGLALDQRARVIPLRDPAFAPEGLLLVLGPVGTRLVGRLYVYETRRIYRGVDLGPAVDPSELEGQVEVGDLDGDGRDELVLGLRGTHEVRVLRVFKNPLNSEPTLGGFGPSYDRPLSLDLGDTIERGVRLADRDGDGHLDVLVHVTGASRHEVMVALGDGELGLGEPHRDAGFDALAEALPEPGNPMGTPTAWPLTAADLDGDGVSDFVGQNGVFLADPDPPHDLRPTFPRRTVAPWTEALAVDVDGNGRRDVVAVAAGEAAVHVHLSVPDEQGAPFVHQPYSALLGGVTRIAAGSLRGTSAADLVIVETAGEGDDRRDTIEVMFARQGDWPSGPIPQARFHRIDHLEVAPGRVSAASADLFDDVQVSTRGGDDAPAYGHLQGNGTDQLRSPFLLLQGLEPSAGVLALAGRFAGNDADRDDLFLIGRDDRQLEWVWPVRGADDAAFAPTRMGAGLQASFGADFDLACARFTAGDVEGDGVDEVLVVFGAAVCQDAEETQLAIARAEDGRLVVEPATLRVAAPSGGAAVLAVDVDDDGDDDLLVAAGGSMSIFHGDVAGLADEPEVIELPVDDPVIDMAAITRASRTTGPRRIALLAGGSVVSVLGERATLAGAAPAGARALRSDDVNGDGLGDVLVLGDGGLTVLFGLAAPPVGGMR